MKLKLLKDCTVGERRAYYRENSSCEVVTEWLPVGDQPASMTIQFRGECSKIPSLKNHRGLSRAGGKAHSFLPAPTRAKLLAMQDLYLNAVGRPVHYYEPVFCLVMLSSKYMGDADNAFAAIKDWLEPSTKVVGTKTKTRGWGADIVFDDRTVVGLAFNSGLLAESDCTTIFLRRLCDVREHLAQFVALISVG